MHEDHFFADHFSTPLQDLFSAVLQEKYDRSSNSGHSSGDTLHYENLCSFSNKYLEAVSLFSTSVLFLQ